MEMEHRDEVCVSPDKGIGVAESYAGKTVFITGATGFLGGVLVEKILRSCPLVEVIYVLVRKKKKFTDIQERLAKMLSLPVSKICLYYDSLL
jgi:fatty acyl-CoA reductase